MYLYIFLFIHFTTIIARHNTKTEKHRHQKFHRAEHPSQPATISDFCCLTLLLADTDGPATAASGLGVLTTDTQTPVVTQTTVRADLLQALEILTQLAVDDVGDQLRALAVGEVALSVQEPRRDLVLRGVLDDGHDPLEFFGGHFTGAVFPKMKTRNISLLMLRSLEIYFRNPRTAW